MSDISNEEKTNLTTNNISQNVSFDETLNQQSDQQNQQKEKKKPKSKKNRTNTSNEIDYLTEDPIITTQIFVCVSFLKNSSVDESKRDPKLTVCGFKVRGSYETYEEAKKRAEFLQKCDPYHNIYIASVGKWCPFEDNPEKAKDNEYMNKDLNKLMKSYTEQQTEAKDFHEIRKQDMVRKAMEEAKKIKENQTDEVINVEIPQTTETPMTNNLELPIDLTTKEINSKKDKKEKKDKKDLTYSESVVNP